MGYIEETDLVRFFKDLQACLSKANVPFHPLSESDLYTWLRS
jgi:hypothetical protein